LVERVILDLCGGTGSWSAPYRDAGYDVHLVTLPDQDVRTYSPPRGVHGVLAAPPCTEFTIAGARWWASKPLERLAEAVEIVRACLRVVAEARPIWWALENPAGGRLPRCVPELGRPLLAFNPCDYGHPYTKKTNVWGRFRPPMKQRLMVPQHYGAERWKASICNHLSPTPTRGQRRAMVAAGYIPEAWVDEPPPWLTRAALRSITPPGFARAFFEANP
jgi:hypothetical protein